jgi:hypothetical protein
MLRKNLAGAKVVLAIFAPARIHSPFRKIQFQKMKKYEYLPQFRVITGAVQNFAAHSPWKILLT